MPVALECRYEGLVNEKERCHVRGVFTYSDGDRYVGEYQDNDMDGFGVYVWKSGTVYRGEWKDSKMHGCGVKLVKQRNGKVVAEEGEFVEDEWKGVTPMCKVKDARKAAEYADVAARMASVFQLDREYDEGQVASKEAESVMRSMKNFKNRKNKLFGLF